MTRRDLSYILRKRKRNADPQCAECGGDGNDPADDDLPCVCLFRGGDFSEPDPLTNRQLIAFAREVLSGYGDGEVGDIDGGVLQDTAHKHGLLLETTATAPCAENCVCAEVGSFPATCYRLHPTLSRDDNYDGPDDGDAWSGGFAPNH